MESLQVTLSTFIEVANRIHYWKPVAVIMYTQLLIHYETFSCTKACLKHRINPLNAELNPICHVLALFGAHHILHVSTIRVNEFPQNPASTPVLKAEGKTSRETVTPDRSNYCKQHKIITSSLSRLILGHIEIKGGRAKHKDFVRQEQKSQITVDYRLNVYS